MLANLYLKYNSGVNIEPRFTNDIGMAAVYNNLQEAVDVSQKINTLRINHYGKRLCILTIVDKHPDWEEEEESYELESSC